MAAIRFAILKRTRDATSLDALLSEWRRCSDDRSEILKRLPRLQGSTRSQAEQFLAWMRDERDEDLARLIVVARSTVESLTDLGAYLESGAVNKRLFYGQVGTHILMICHLLDPLIVLTCAHRGHRWGLRVRRIRWGAGNYYSLSAVHQDEKIMVDGVVVWPFDAAMEVPPAPWPRWRLIPSKEHCQSKDSSDITVAEGVLRSAQLDDHLRKLFP